jgi:O-antigen/teichoic acid export membrane protein
LLAAAELIVAPSLLPLVHRYQAQERLFISGALLTIAPIARFVAVGSTFVLDVHDLRTFAILYLGGISLATATALCWFWPRTQTVVQHYRFVDTIREGTPFVVSGVAVTAGSELDKTIMLRAAGDFAAGQYSAAYRVIQAAILPVNSLVLAVTPRLFKASSPSVRAGAHLVLLTAAYALVAAMTTWLLAPLLPWLLGPQFSPSISILRVMCVLLLTGSLRQIIVAQLTAADGQRSRNWIEGLAAAGTVIAMLSVVPVWGAWGAIFVLAVADVGVASMSWLSLASRAHDSSSNRGPA